MKVPVVLFILCLMGTIKQDVESASPPDDWPKLGLFYNYFYFAINGSAESYYTVYLVLFNGEPEEDRDQITRYLAAVEHNGAGNFDAGIEACGSDTPIPADTYSFYPSMGLSFILDAATGALVTDPLVVDMFITPGPPQYLRDTSGATTCGAVLVADGLRLVIQTFASTDTSTPGVYSVYWDFTIGPAGGTLHSRSRSLDINDSNFLDPEYVIPPPPIFAPPTLTLPLETIDASGNGINTINLGEEFKLRVSATILVDAGVTYADGLDLAGVVVKECSVGTDVGVTANTRTFIADYCSVNTDIFLTSLFGPGIGFTKNISTLTGNSKTYVADSHRLEAAAITPNPNTITSSNSLYFKCTVDVNCYDDATGSCSAGHCSSRKKRAVEKEMCTGEKQEIKTEMHTRVKRVVQTEMQPQKKQTAGKVVHKFKISSAAAAKPRVLHENTFETILLKHKMARPCSEILMFKVIVGTLGLAVAVMFFVIIYTYYDLKKVQKKAQRKTKMKVHDLDFYKMSGGSRTELTADALSSTLSEKHSKRC